MPSLLDRLIDPESGGTNWRRGYGPEQMMEAVRRDLEELLNTRQSLAGLPEGFPETEKSVIGYGLPDLTSLNAVTTQERDDIGRVIELIVGRFEPRLKEVRATLVDAAADGKERTVRFHIAAK